MSVADQVAPVLTPGNWLLIKVKPPPDIRKGDNGEEQKEIIITIPGEPEETTTSFLTDPDVVLPRLNKATKSGNGTNKGSSRRFDPFSGSCAIKGCSTRFATSKEARQRRKTLRQYHFPDDPEERSAWLQLCSQPENFSIERAFVCSLHFPDEDKHLASCFMDFKMHIKERGDCRCARLRPGARPSLKLTGTSKIVKRFEPFSGACVVKGCPTFFNNGREARKHRFTLRQYLFPENSTEKAAWLELCGLEGSYNTVRSYICARHFNEEDRHSRACFAMGRSQLAIPGGCRCIRLREGARPCLNLPNLETERGKRKRRERLKKVEPVDEVAVPYKKEKMSQVERDDESVVTSKKEKMSKMVLDDEGAVRPEEEKMLSDAEGDDLEESTPVNMQLKGKIESVLSTPDHPSDVPVKLEIEVLHDMCRICSGCFEPSLFTFGEEGRALGLQKLLYLCLGLEVCEDDVLPLLVCRHCLPILQQTAQLQNMTQASNKKFIDILERNQLSEQSNSCTKFLKSAVMVDKDSLFPDDLSPLSLNKNGCDKVAVLEVISEINTESEETKKKDPGINFLTPGKVKSCVEKSEELPIPTINKLEYADFEQFRCKICSAKYPSKQSLASHYYAKHMSVWSFQCLLCQCLFKLKMEVEDHLKMKHSHRLQDGVLFTQFVKHVSPYKCELCGKFFGSASQRRSHTITAHAQGHDS